MLHPVDLPVTIFSLSSLRAYRNSAPGETSAEPPEIKLDSIPERGYTQRRLTQSSGGKILVSGCPGAGIFQLFLLSTEAGRTDEEVSIDLPCIPSQRIAVANPSASPAGR